MRTVKLDNDDDDDDGEKQRKKGKITFPWGFTN